MPKRSETTKQGTAVARQRARASAVEKNESPDIPALLKHYGISTVPKAVYEWGGYRYSNPGDAIAAAKREASA